MRTIQLTLDNYRTAVIKNNEYVIELKEEKKVWNQTDITWTSECDLMIEMATDIGVYQIAKTAYPI